MKILFIAPYDDITAYGVRILSSLLKKEGYPTEIIFTPYLLKRTNSDHKKNLSDTIAERCKDSYFIGFSFFSCHFNAVKELTAELKSRTDIPIMWGGKHISARPEDAIGLADFICVGEGEIAIKNFLLTMKNCENKSQVPGIWQIKNKNIQKTPLSSIINDLDTIPYPDYSLDGHYLWDGTTLLEMTPQLLSQNLKVKGEVVYQTLSSRGCPYNCTYCSTFKSLYANSNYLRFRTAENVIEEIKTIKSRYPFFETIALSDDNFLALNESNIEEFATLYKKEISLPFRCLAHIHEVNKKKLGILVDAGLKEIQMGIQTGSEKTRKLYKRGPSTDKILTSVNMINQFKGQLMPYYDFIIDNPFEEEEDLITTLQMIQKFPKPYRLNIFSLIFLPGTQLQKMANEKGLIYDMTKEWEFQRKNYINFLFYLHNRLIPKWLMAILISKPMIKIMNNKPIVNLLYFMRDFIKKQIKRT